MMTMTQSKKMLFGCAALIVVFLLSMGSAKPTNPCSQHQYRVKYEDGSTSCEDCSSCPPGQGLSEECGKDISPSAMVTCEPCTQGVNFSGKDDTSSCTVCSTCSKDQVVLRNCSSEWNIKCAKRCYSKDRYYNDDKGECLACSNCCGDDQDVVEDECKKKLGAGSNMICSFDSSVNRCDKSITSPHKLTTVVNQTTTAYTSPSQVPKGEQTLPLTAQSSHHISQRKDQDFWTAGGILALLVAACIGCGCYFYLYKTRKLRRLNHGLVTGVQCSLDDKALEDGNEVKLAKSGGFYILETRSSESREPLLKEGDPGILKVDSCEMDRTKEGAEKMCGKFDGLEAVSPESKEPLLKEGGSGMLTCSCEMGTEEFDSKLLSSLLENESDLQKICQCLDTPMPGVGHYREVAQYYGSDHYQIVSVFEKHWGGPSRAIIKWLAAEQIEITVAEFATVVGKEAKRNDVVKLLKAYDLQQKT